MSQTASIAMTSLGIEASPFAKFLFNLATPGDLDPASRIVVPNKQIIDPFSGQDVVANEGRPLLYIPRGVNAGIDLQNEGDEAVIYRDGTVMLLGDDADISPASLVARPDGFSLVHPSSRAGVLAAARFAAAAPADAGRKTGSSGSASSGTKAAGGGGGGGGGMSTETYWKLFTQGGPMAADAAGNFARSIGTAAQLYRAGTYRDDPLGTQDPESSASFMMQWLVPDGYFGRELTREDKYELDLIAGGWNQAYLFGKFFKYGAGIVGNVAAMNKIAGDKKISEEARRDLALKNYYDFVGNAAFLVEKVCYALGLPMLAVAQAAGPDSILWDVGYLGGAAIYNAALALATVAWYGKVRCSLSVVELEKVRFMEGLKKGENYDIDTACINIALFNFANALGRIPKHMVAHVSTLALGLALYYPKAFSFLADNEYIDKAIKKLGEGTPAELVYSWSSFGFIVPRSIVYGSIAFCVLAPLVGLAVNANKVVMNIKEHARLKSMLKTGGLGSDEAAKHASRLGHLHIEHVVNALAVSGALCVLGSGVATAYPATEPHSLFLTALYGIFVFAQFGIGQFDQIKKLPAYLVDKLFKKRDAVDSQKSKETRTGTEPPKKSFFRKMMESLRLTREIIRQVKEEKKKAVEDLSFTQRVSRKAKLFAANISSWKFFLRAYMSQKKTKKIAKAK